jgi:hypothetical protein
MFPQRFGPVLFALVLSGLMSLLVSGVTTIRAVGVASSFIEIWAVAWLTSWPIAFPVVLVAAPSARAFVQKLLRQ